MCIFRAPKAPTPQATPPPIAPRNEQPSVLPTKKELVDEDAVTEVEYGSSAKQASAGAGNKVGAAALRIPLNTGGSANAGQGGANTGNP